MPRGPWDILWFLLFIILLIVVLRAIGVNV